MYLERFRWGPWTEGEELFNALQRGFLPAAYEYVYRTEDRYAVKGTVLRLLRGPPERRSKEAVDLATEDNRQYHVLRESHRVDKEVKK